MNQESYKISVECRHCGDRIEHFPRLIESETRFREIDKFYYCQECLKKISQYYLRNSMLE